MNLLVVGSCSYRRLLSQSTSRQLAWRTCMACLRCLWACQHNDVPDQPGLANELTESVVLYAANRRS